MTVLALALRNVARNRRRSLLTGAVVVFGFAAVALAGGFMAQSLEGLREGTIRNGVGHLQLARAAEFEPGGSGSFDALLARAADAEAVVRRDPAVVEVLPRIDFVGLVSSGERSIPFLGTGVDPAREAGAMDLPQAMRDGRWLEEDAGRGVVLGADLATSLSVRVGDTVTLLATTEDGTLNAVDATVAGLADIPIRELSERYVAASLALAQELLGIDGRVSKLVVVLRDSGAAPEALARITGALRAGGLELTGRTWEQLATFYRQVRLLYYGIFGFMGAVLAVVVLLAAANTMTMAAAERTREIGTLRALGTRPGRIRALFLAEGAVLAVLGCAAGALVALVVRLALNHSGIVLPPPPGVSHGMPLHVKLYGTAYAVGAVAMLATLLLASYFPARRAARMSIVEALAHV